MATRTTTPADEDRVDPASPEDASARDIEQVRRAVRGIRFGEVRVIIQDGVIVQIERVEKQRLR